MRNHWRPSSRVLLSPLDDRNGVFQRFECVWASRHQTSRSGLESTTRATQTQPAGQDLQETCEFHKRRRTEKQNRMNDVEKKNPTTSHSRVFHSFSSAAPGGAYFPQPCTVFQRELCGLHVQLCPLAAQWPSTTWEPRARVHTTHLYTQRERALRGFPAADWFRGLSSSRDSLSRSLNGHPMGREGGGCVGGSWDGHCGRDFFFWYILANLTYPQDCWTVEQSHWCWWKEG